MYICGPFPKLLPLMSLHYTFEISWKGRLIFSAEKLAKISDQISYY